MLVDSQLGRCFWCRIHFETEEYRHGRLVPKQIEIDHIEPFIYASNEEASNIVASCSICNGIKYSLIFRDIYEARNHIHFQRIAKGYTGVKPALELSELREAIPEQAQNS